MTEVMPVVGILADPTFESLQQSEQRALHYGVFVCMISETILHEFRYNWSQVVLMSFSLRDFGKQLILSSQYCQVSNRPRWWMEGDTAQTQDVALCDHLIYLTPVAHHTPNSMVFFQFPRKKKRIIWSAFATDDAR